jgi:DnaK suppressor protein
MHLRRSDSPLTQRQLAEFRMKLECRCRELRVAAEQVSKQGRTIIDDAALDVADRAVNASTKEQLFRQAEELRRMLQVVEAALERIRDGSFGQCLGCGRRIGIKRLEAVPWTECCVACQERRERGELPGNGDVSWSAHPTAAARALAMSDHE